MNEERNMYACLCTWEENENKNETNNYCVIKILTK